MHAIRRTAALLNKTPIRHYTSILPASLQPTGPDSTTGIVATKLKGDMNLDNPPSSIRPDLWKLYITTIFRLDQAQNRVPKKSVLHWILLNAESKEELDMALDLTEHWRMRMRPISQGTTQLWSEACIRLQHPAPFMTMLLDRWKYRQLPISYSLSRFIKFLGQQAIGGDDALLDDAFRLFALYPYYDVPWDAAAYGALVEACCLANTDEAWRRALVVSEETLAEEKPMITQAALKALEQRSEERGEKEMAARYKSLGETLVFDEAPQPSKAELEK